MLNSWKITSEDGCEYLFETKEESSSNWGSSTPRTSSWYLSSIKTPLSNQTITFQYDIEYYNYQLPVSETKYKVFNTTNEPCGQSKPPVEKIYANQIINNARRLSKIIFPSGTVEFVAGNYRYDLKGGRVLKTLNVYNKNEIIKTFTLNYDYDGIPDDGHATATSEENTLLRLYLNNIKEKNLKDQSEVPCYTFSYISGNLPDRLTSNAQDHWGGYNGEVNNTSLIPSFTTRRGQFIQGAERGSVEYYGKMRSLDKITYQTGGFTEFEYEGNTAMSNLLPGNTINFNAVFGIGSCHIMTGANVFTISNPTASVTRVNLALRGSAPITANNCNGNASIPNNYDPNSWIYFQIINITNPSSAYVVYNSSGQVTLGSSTGGTDVVNLTNGIYKIKAIKGNTNFGLNAPDITEYYANIYGAFYFEANGYWLDDTGAKKVGGLRVKKITNYDPVSMKKTIKIYDYSADDAPSSGIVSYVPEYQYTYSEGAYCYGEGGAGSQLVDYDVCTSFSNAPLTQMQGGTVGYSKVSVFDAEEINNEVKLLTKTELYYNNQPDFYPYVLPYYYNTSSICYLNTLGGGKSSFPFAPSVSYYWRRGNLLRQIFYKKSGANFIPVREIVNDYKYNYRSDETYYNESTDVRAMRVGLFRNVSNAGSMSNSYIYAVASYFIPSRLSKLTKTEEYEYGPTGNKTLKKETSYEFNDLEHLQLSKRKIKTSTGEDLITTYKYPKDFNTAEPYKTLYNNHIWSPIIEEETARGVSGSESFLRSLKTNYTTWNNNINQIQPLNITTKQFADSYEQRVVFGGYDPFGNLLSVSKDLGPKISYIYSYSGAYPVAKIENALYTTIESILGGAPSMDAFRDMPYPTDNEVNTFLSPLRSSPSLKDAIITTYTYKPLVGMTSLTDSRGQATYYEYDGFQRLQSVKDASGNVLKSYDYHYRP